MPVANLFDGLSLAEAANGLVISAVAIFVFVSRLTTKKQILNIQDELEQTKKELHVALHTIEHLQSDLENERKQSIEKDGLIKKLTDRVSELEARSIQKLRQIRKVANG